MHGPDGLDSPSRFFKAVHQIDVALHKVRSRVFTGDAAVGEGRSMEAFQPLGTQISTTLVATGLAAPTCRQRS